MRFARQWWGQGSRPAVVAALVVSLQTGFNNEEIVAFTGRHLASVVVMERLSVVHEDLAGAFDHPSRLKETRWLHRHRPSSGSAPAR